MWTPAEVEQVRASMRERVGGFFRNTLRRSARTCVVCTRPVEGYERCYACNEAREQFGAQLADVVMPLAYAYHRADQHRFTYGKHQSEQHMWSYKEPQPGPGCWTDLTMMLLVALHWHRRCAEERVGIPWSAWAVVPSSKRARTGEHPLVALGRAAGMEQAGGPLQFPRAVLAPTGPPSNDRDVRADRFVVTNPEVVVGRHVLLLEDTWVTGGSVQSAAVALKRAGAAAVTVICLARWLREDGPADSSGWFGSLIAPYDALSCPAGSGDFCGGPFPPA